MTDDQTRLVQHSRTDGGRRVKSWLGRVRRFRPLVSAVRLGVWLLGSTVLAGLAGYQLVETGAGQAGYGRRCTQAQYAAAYDAVRGAFQTAHGTLLEMECYGARQEAAVALTKRQMPGSRRWFTPWRPKDALDWCVHIRFPPTQSADLLGLQNRCELFRPQQYRISEERYKESFAQTLYAASRTVLQLEPPADGKVWPLLPAMEDSMKELQARYDWIQSRLARFYYMRGVGLGVAAIALTVLALLLLSAGLHGPAQATTVLLCMGGGAAAAAANAMLRLVQGTSAVQGDESRLLLGLFGALRPALGAIFALIAFALIQGGLVPVKLPAAPDTLFWFVIGIAFIAGFSENFAPDLVQRASAV